MSPPRVSELITSDRNPASMFLLPFNDAFVLVKGWDYTSEECTTQPLPPCLAHTFTHSFCPYLFPRRPGLFNYRFTAQSLLTGCMSNSMLAQSQTADGARKSLHIILKLFHWPTVQNIHLHWASLKSALTASKHWTPSTATTVSIFKQYPPQNIQLRTFPHSHTRAHSFRRVWLIHNHPSNRLYLAAGVKASFSSTIRNSYMSTDSHSVFLNDVVLANHIFNMILIDSSCIVCSPSPH